MIRRRFNLIAITLCVGLANSYAYAEKTGLEESLFLTTGNFTTTHQANSTVIYVKGLLSDRLLPSEIEEQRKKMAESRAYFDHLPRLRSHLEQMRPAGARTGSKYVFARPKLLDRIGPTSIYETTVKSQWAMLTTEPFDQSSLLIDKILITFKREGAKKQLASFSGSIDREFELIPQEHGARINIRRGALNDIITELAREIPNGFFRRDFRATIRLWSSEEAALNPSKHPTQVFEFTLNSRQLLLTLGHDVPKLGRLQRLCIALLGE